MFKLNVNLTFYKVGLAEVLRSRGSKPNVIVGHSVGEVAAAWAAGCLSLKDATCLSWHRSKLQQLVAGICCYNITFLIIFFVFIYIVYQVAECLLWRLVKLLPPN